MLERVSYKTFLLRLVFRSGILIDIVCRQSFSDTVFRLRAQMVSN